MATHVLEIRSPIADRKFGGRETEKERRGKEEGREIDRKGERDRKETGHSTHDFIRRKLGRGEERTRIAIDETSPSNLLI